jgi:hypothetical protein
MSIRCTNAAAVKKTATRRAASDLQQIYIGAGHRVVVEHPWPDGTLIQGRDADRRTPIAVVVGRARVELATVGELAALRVGCEVTVVPEPLFCRLPTRIADGTLVQGIVDPCGRVDLTPVALLAGGARAEFHDTAEIIQCGYSDLPVWPIPSRVFRALPLVPRDGTYLRDAQDLALYRIVAGKRRPVNLCGPACPAPVWTVAAAVWTVCAPVWTVPAPVWTVPARVLDHLGW